MELDKRVWGVGLDDGYGNENYFPVNFINIEISDRSITELCFCMRAREREWKTFSDDDTHLFLCLLCSAGTIDFTSPLNSDSICSETSYMKPGS
jgi:hypothetical protein